MGSKILEADWEDRGGRYAPSVKDPLELLRIIGRGGGWSGLGHASWDGPGSLAPECCRAKIRVCRSVRFWCKLGRDSAL